MRASDDAGDQWEGENVQCYTEPSPLYSVPNTRYIINPRQSIGKVKDGAYKNNY